MFHLYKNIISIPRPWISVHASGLNISCKTKKVRWQCIRNYATNQRRMHAASKVSFFLIMNATDNFCKIVSPLSFICTVVVFCFSPTYRSFSRTGYFCINLFSHSPFHNNNSLFSPPRNDSVMVLFKAEIAFAVNKNQTTSSVCGGGRQVLQELVPAGVHIGIH